MKTPKEIYDPLYEVYRNLENKPAIPLDAKPLIWKAMQTYSDQQNAELESENKRLRKGLLGLMDYVRRECKVVHSLSDKEIEFILEDAQSALKSHTNHP